MPPQSQPATPTYIWKFSAVGAGGGVAAFLLSRLINAGPFVGKPVYFDLPAEALFGAMAALFGVYLLTASDLTSPRTMVFALACGLSWSPVITATQAYVQQHSDNQTVATASDAQSIANQLPSQGTQSASTVQAAASQASTALDTLPQVANTASRTAVVNSTTSVVNKLATPDATTTNVNALKTIGMASLKSAPTVSQLAIEKLRFLADTARQPQTKQEAVSAISALTAASTQTKPVAQ